MKKAILAKKVGMTQIFNEAGELVPVTVLQAGPCVVTQVKTVENDGYDAVQVGFEDIREKLVNKPVKGMFDKAGVSYKRYVREFKLEGEYAVKDEIKAEILKLEIRLTQLQLQREKDSRAQLRDMDSQEDLWLMVQSIIDMLVQTVLVHHQVRYLKERECLVTWVARRLQLRTLKSLELTQKRTYS